VWTPPLAHWHIEAIHALVVTGYTEDNILVNDPIMSNGPISIPNETFLQAWAATDYLMIIIQPADNPQSD
jgi:uncharacterized protein YvpB